MKTAIITIMIKYAYSMLGTPYIWAGNGAVGFDCSGFVCELLRSVGIIGKEDLTSQNLYDLLTKNKRVSFSQKPEVGDFVFYGKGPKDISHVAMIYEILEDAGEKKILVVEAGGGNSSIDSPEKAMAKGAAVRIRPFAARRDVVAIVSPFSNTLNYIKL